MSSNRLSGLSSSPLKLTEQSSMRLAKRKCSFLPADVICQFGKKSAPRKRGVSFTVVNKVSPAKSRELVDVLKYQMGFSHFKEKSQRLDQKLDLQKNLINMVVHDLRCPTAQIKYSTSNQLESLEALKVLIDDLYARIEFDQDIIQQCLEAMEACGLDERSPKLTLTTDNSSDLQIAVLEKQLASVRGVFSPEDLPLFDRFASKVAEVNSNMAKKRRSGGPKIQHSSSFYRLSKSVANTNQPSEQSPTPRLQQTPQIEISDELSDDDDDANADLETSREMACLSPMLDRLDTQASGIKFIDNVNNMQRQWATSKRIEEASRRTSLNSANSHAGLAMNTFNSSLQVCMSESPSCHQQRLQLEQLRSNLRNLNQNNAVNFTSLEVISSELSKVGNQTAACEYSSAVLLNLINDLLDLAKAENNAFSINKEFFDLEEALHEAKSTLDFMATQKRITTELSIDIKASKALGNVFGDSGRLKQVIVNLMSNALKFTDEGGMVQVLVDVISEPTSAVVLKDDIDKMQGEKVSPYTVQIVVKDNGQGISKEGQSKLFKTYSSLAEHKKSNERGTGLGLCICKMIVERMGGSISVESQINEGTSFKLKIPFMSLVSKSPGAQDLEASSESMTTPRESFRKFKFPRTETEVKQTRKVLNLKLKSSSKLAKFGAMQTPCFNKSSSQRSLESLGSVNRSARSVRQAQRSAQEWGASPLMTMNTPRQVSMFSKQGGPILKHTRSLSLASSLRLAHRAKCLSSICTTDDRWNHLRVLIVNDEPVSLMILEQMFREQLGTRVQTATNGQAAVDKTCDSYFDLVVMDLHMPVLDGFEATRQIRAGVLNKKSVIVALSASTFTEDLKKQCRDAGFSSWLTSPVVLKSLITDVLEKYLSDI